MALPMRSGSVWDEFRQMREEMDRLLSGVIGGTALAPRAVTEWVPAVDITETPDEIILSAELPGMTKDDVQIEVQDNVLTIRGEKKEEREEKEGKRYIYERRFGSFTRSFTLPANVDPNRISARFENGVLKVTVPKTEEARGRRVNIA